MKVKWKVKRQSKSSETNCRSGKGCGKAGGKLTSHPESPKQCQQSQQCSFKVEVTLKCLSEGQKKLIAKLDSEPNIPQKVSQPFIKSGTMSTVQS